MTVFTPEHPFLIWKLPLLLAGILCVSLCSANQKGDMASASGAAGCQSGNKHILLVCVWNRLVFPKHLQSHPSGSFHSFYTHLEMTKTDIKAVREMIIKVPAFLSNKFAVSLPSDSFERWENQMLSIPPFQKNPFTIKKEVMHRLSDWCEKSFFTNVRHGSQGITHTMYIFLSWSIFSI